LNTQPDSPKSGFIVLRTSSLQVALGHPLNYVRTLMQVNLLTLIRCFPFENSVDYINLDGL